MVILVRELLKTLDGRPVLNGIDLEIDAGRLFALLGPNGAGKTTLVRILATLLRPDAGQVILNGHDVVRNPEGARRSIGLSGQYAAVDEKLTGYENLYLLGRLHGLSGTVSAAGAHALLDRFRLVEQTDRRVGSYSGGMRRRLDLAGALVARPPVVVLDEPTTGLDPRSRFDIWNVIGELVKDGTTVLMTTQYLEEADQLADLVAVLDRGRVIARGTVHGLRAKGGQDLLEVVVADGAHLTRAVAVLDEVGLGPPRADRQARQAVVRVAEGTSSLMWALRRLEAEGVGVVDVALRRPTLEEVFLTLTGGTPGADLAERQSSETVR